MGRFIFILTTCTLIMLSQANLAMASLTTSFVLEPFEISNYTAGAITTEYEPTNMLFSLAGGRGSAFNVQSTLDSYFGNGALRVERSRQEPLSTESANNLQHDTLQWVEANKAFNCMGAQHLSLWYKAPHAQSAFNMSLLLFDDTDCSENCTNTEALESYVSEPFLVEHTPQFGGGSSWHEMLVDLSGTPAFSPVSGNNRALALDHIRGWGVTFEIDDHDRNGTTVVLLDQFACIGGGDLFGAMFKTSDSFAQAVSEGIWTENYHLSKTSQNLTRTTLESGSLEVDYTIEQTEDWGGFFSYAHVFPGNSYFNLSDATKLRLDYNVLRPSSAPGRAHFRIVLGDSLDCYEFCQEAKSLEFFYSFNYILDAEGSGTIDVVLQGDEDPSSPLWRTGWFGSAHNGVFDTSNVKGVILEFNVDSQGTMSSLVTGSLAVNNLQVVDKINDDENSNERQGNTDGETKVALVLESFEDSTLKSKPSKKMIMKVYNPSNLAFSSLISNAGAVVNVLLTGDALFGEGALRIETGSTHGTGWALRWVDLESPHNCIGASHLSIWYKIPKVQPPVEMVVTLFDDKKCIHNCTETVNLRGFKTVPVTLEFSDKESQWREVVIDFSTDLVDDRTENLAFDQIRGWELSFLDRQQSDSTYDILIDHLSCVGEGDLVGAMFKTNRSFAEAVSEKVWNEVYFNSLQSQNLTRVMLDKESLRVAYTIQQTESWGGYIQFSYFLPGNSYYNLSEASELMLDYGVSTAATVAGRAHFRVILSDSAGCLENCRDPKMSEAYYSFSYILDDTSEGTISILMEGSDDPSSPLWRTGWSGSADNGAFDRTNVKGMSFELSIDAQGDLDSLVSGAMSFGGLRARQEPLVQDTGIKGIAIIEPDIEFRGPEFKKVPFLGVEECTQMCIEDFDCLYGYTIYRDCFLASFVGNTSVRLSSEFFDQAPISTFWVDDARKRGSFCDLCECKEEDRAVDCRGRDLLIVPKQFNPTSWSPRILDLSGNPRLSMIGAGALEAVATSLQKLVLPYSTRYLSVESIANISNLRTVLVANDAGEEVWSEHRIMNAVVQSTASFSNICCDVANHVPLSLPVEGISFCQVQRNKPGVDSLYMDFINFIDPELISSLTESSGFASEASESHTKCAEYCSLHPDCLFFTFDARYSEAQHKCNTLLNNGTRSDYVCCNPGDYADLEKIEPGYVSGISPQARHSIFNAAVLVSPTSLLADVSTRYTTQFEVNLGASPVRGAVWIEPVLVSSTMMNISIIPSGVALYDNITHATFTVQVSDVEAIEGRVETLVFSNKIRSCDKAFTALANEASNVYVRVVVPELHFSTAQIATISVLGALLLVSMSAMLLFLNRRRKLFAQNETRERDEEMEVRKLVRTDDVYLLIGRVATILVIIATSISTTVWANRIFQKALDAKRNPGLMDNVESSASSRRVFISVLVVFGCILVSVFALYDWLVRRRHHKLIFNAAKTSELVRTMFPEQIRDKVLNETRTNKNKKGEKNGAEEVLAELYPNTTLCIADISGFVAWQSSRQPQQVFYLLEQVFGAFDALARKHGVYKVESIGETFTAIAGAPEEREDHAEVMSRFASSCVRKFSKLRKRLTISLGPDTGELALRVGLHSGQLVLGVLRNERARYQLFGDCVHCASSMLATCNPGCIQLSFETAELLKTGEKEHWFSASELGAECDAPSTYWLKVSTVVNDKQNFESSCHSCASSDKFADDLDDRAAIRNARLIDWGVNILVSLVKKIIAHRRGRQVGSETSDGSRPMDRFCLTEGETFFDEVAEIIELPPSSGDVCEQVEVDEIEVDPTVVFELKELVERIASMYNDLNPFHNFEHANHVTMSIVKLLSRIVKPSDSLDDFSNNSYGITDDPLTHLACAFSGLIHDADHPGVFNSQFSKENPLLSERYNHRSVAEQNSLAMTLELFSSEQFANLRATIFATSEDQERFRQLVINMVMATDIVDKDLKELRNARWKTAFDDEHRPSEPRLLTQNRKATIVIEHLIQASDVAHTMQHWDVYRKWNQRLFMEMYTAYNAGRSSVDPTTNWAKGEIGFFDFYIIPLAKKLKDCGVFGVSSAEYLNYALQNRRRWELEGPAITAQMVEAIQQQEQEQGNTTPVGEERWARLDI